MADETLQFTVPVRISYDPSYRGARAAVVREAKEVMQRLPRVGGGGEHGYFRAAPGRARLILPRKVDNRPRSIDLQGLTVVSITSCMKSIEAHLPATPDQAARLEELYATALNLQREIVHGEKPLVTRS